MQTLTQLDRQWPQCLEVEQNLLGILLARGEFVCEVVGKLDASAFYLNSHQLIYKAACALFQAGNPVDFISVGEFLSDHNQLEAVGGRYYLNSLAESIATTGNLDWCIETVKDKALLRELIKVSYRNLERAFDGSADEALSAAQSDLLALSPEREALSNEQVVDQALDELLFPDERLGVTSGYRCLDTRVRGWRPGQMITVAARPSMGKSTLALNFALAAVGETPTLFLSQEMTAVELQKKAIVAVARSLREKELVKAAEVVRNIPLVVRDIPGLTITGARAEICRFLAKHPTGKLVIIDHIQLMRGQGDNRTQELTGISRALKSMAKELNLAVMPLCQLNRGVEGRQDKHPMLSDLRDSGAIEEDSDCVMLLYRDDYYNPESEESGLIEINVAKNRNGPTFTSKLLFDKGRSLITERASYDA